MFDPLPHHLATCKMYTIFSRIIPTPLNPRLILGSSKMKRLDIKKFNNPEPHRNTDHGIMTMGVGRVVLIMFAFVWRLPPGRESTFSRHRPCFATAKE